MIADPTLIKLMQYEMFKGLDTCIYLCRCVVKLVEVHCRYIWLDKLCGGGLYVLRIANKLVFPLSLCTFAWLSYTCTTGSLLFKIDKIIAAGSWYTEYLNTDPNPCLYLLKNMKLVGNIYCPQKNQESEKVSHFRDFTIHRYPTYRYCTVLSHPDFYIMEK